MVYRLGGIDDFTLIEPNEEPSLKLTLNELIALCDYPTFGGRASVSNYPEYNDVVDKIYEFVHQHRNE